MKCSLVVGSLILFSLQAYEARIHGVKVLAKKLEDENFHRIDWIKSFTEKIEVLWVQLRELLEWRSSRLNKHLNLHKIFQEMIYIIDWTDEVKVGENNLLLVKKL